MKRFVLALGIFCLSFSSGQAEPSYDLTTFNLLGDFRQNFPAGMNDLGQVVGYGITMDDQVAPFIFQNGSITYLTPAGAPSPLALAGINNSGVIIGNGYSEEGNNVAGSFSGGGNWTSFTPQGVDSSVFAINSSGISVGSFSVGAISHAAIFSSGTVIDLDPTGTTTSGARGINDSGMIAGNKISASDPDGIYGQAFVYTEAGGMVGLGTLKADSSGRSNANAINAAGTIVGWSDVDDGTPTAFIWDQTNGMRLMSNVPGNSASAQGINDLGQIVGVADLDGNDATNDDFAFLYVDGQMLNLNDLVPDLPEGFTLRVAYSINNNGEIFGWGTDSIGRVNGFFLSQVPEPSTLLMFALGVGALALVARRKKQRVSPI